MRGKKNGELPQLLSAYHNINLATKEYRIIWESAWPETPSPARLEVDLFFILKEEKPYFEKAFLAAIEVKYFRSQRRRFFEGIGQTLAYGLLGFDGVSLWHIFEDNIPDEKAARRADISATILNGFNLPIFYLAFKIESPSRVHILSPRKLSKHIETKDLIGELSKYFLQGKNRNPMLRDHRVNKSRKMLKALFNIPLD